jgi:ribosomal protein S18 acetylase RimI-like enzyme
LMLLFDPECVALETGTWPDDAPVVPRGDHPPGATPLVVSARRRGAVVGVVRGWVLGGQGEIRSVLVAPGERGQGIARHLAAAFDHAARSADPEVSQPDDG